jgi:hypothetical protein
MQDPIADEVAVEADSAAERLLRRFGRDALLIAVHARHRAKNLGLKAEASAWRRIHEAIAAKLETQADQAWIAGQPARSRLHNLNWFLSAVNT